MSLFCQVYLMLSGRVTTTIHPQRGLRQGDPLSPYLFIMVADVLSHMINHFAGCNALVGIKLSRQAPMISHCFFANGSIFFLQASE